MWQYYTFGELETHQRPNNVHGAFGRQASSMNYNFPRVVVSKRVIAVYLSKKATLQLLRE